MKKIQYILAATLGITSVRASASGPPAPPGSSARPGEPGDAVTVRARVERDGSLVMQPVVHLRLGQSSTVELARGERSWTWDVKVEARPGGAFAITSQVREAGRPRVAPSLLLPAGTWGEVRLDAGPHTWHIAVRVDPSPG